MSEIKARVLQPLTRATLLSEFETEARLYYGRSASLPEGIAGLLPHLVKLVPHDGFERSGPPNRLPIMGEINSALALEIIEDLGEFHYHEPVEMPLEIVLSSEGGDVEAGAAIASELSLIRQAGREVRIHVAGFAMSSAFDVLQMADHRSAEPTASFMIHHEHFSLEEGASAQSHALEGKASIDRAKLVFAEWSKRTSRAVDYYMKKIDGHEWYFDANEALAEGLIDEIRFIPAFKPTPAANGRPARRRPAKSQAASEENNDDSASQG